MPDVDWLLGERGFDANWPREALKDKGISAGIPVRMPRKTVIRYDKRRNRIGIVFGRLKAWRRAATQYDRSPMVFLSSIALPALAIPWI